MAQIIEAASKFLLAKLSDGTSTPLAAANLYPTTDLSADIYEGESKDLDYNCGNPQNVPSVKLDPFNQFNFSIDASPSGVAGTEPAASIFLQACGFMPMATATTVTYTRGSPSALRSVNVEMRHMVDGTNNYRYRTNNARGKIGLTMKAGDFPSFKISNLMGDYVLPDISPKVAPDCTAIMNNLPLPFDALNTLIFMIGTYSLCVSEFTVDNLAGFTPKRRSLAGGCYSTSMKTEKSEGNITFLESNWASEFNPFVLAESHKGIKVFPLEIVHGVGAGKVIEIASTRIQLLNVKNTEIDGDSAKTASIRFLSPLSLVFK